MKKLQSLELGNVITHKKNLWIQGTTSDSLDIAIYWMTFHSEAHGCQIACVTGRCFAAECFQPHHLIEFSIGSVCGIHWQQKAIIKNNSILPTLIKPPVINCELLWKCCVCLRPPQDSPAAYHFNTKKDLVICKHSIVNSKANKEKNQDFSYLLINTILQ